ncbi:multiheme c-type cytochrome [Crateriforma spongiae]|uniref:multiheme c-type cytochrome n=1 Tax=Crateriforma spongiae TaxID=2724528 RepID=UPI001447E419|nr:multiheme c-type cytochrome [Crateriforma spongiae]
MLAFTWIESGLVAMLLVAAGLVVFLSLAADSSPDGRPVRRGRSWLAIFGWIGLVGVVAAAAASHRDPITVRSAKAKWPEVRPHDRYVGSDTCRSCHPGQHQSWHDSWHRTMTQDATPENVIAPFDGRTLGPANAQVKVYRDGDTFMMDLNIAPFAAGQGASPIRESFPVVLATGMHHEQQYWLKAQDDVPQLLPAPYSYLATTGQWIPRQASFLQPPDEYPFPLTTPGAWHETCIKCHATGGRLHASQIDHERQGFSAIDPTVMELGISCEACHGPGGDHVDANKNPLNRYANHLRGSDDTIINPAKLDHMRASSICGSCHSIRMFKDFEQFTQYVKDGFEFRPGDDLFESGMEDLVQCSTPKLAEKFKKRLTKPDMQLDNWFWSDGMVRVSGRELTGMSQAPCFQNGEMSCLSCHQMHREHDDPRDPKQWANDQLAIDMHSDQACLQCHDDMRSEKVIAAHTKHAPGSAGSQCMNCHMSYTVTGLMKAIRSHMIDTPSVQTTLETGRPNACNQCHMDKSLAWTAEHLRDWYGYAVPDMDPQQKDLSLMADMAVRGNAGARAIAAWTLGWDQAQAASGKRWTVPFLTQLLRDPYDVVRFSAYRSLKTVPGFEDFQFEFMSDADSINESAKAALRRWEAMTDRESEVAVDTDTPSAVLWKQDGAFDRQAFDELLQQRDDTPMQLLE